MLTIVHRLALSVLASLTLAAPAGAAGIVARAP